MLVLKMSQVANKTAWGLDPNDREDAQLFTFVHELVHVVTGGSGVSNEDIENLSADKPRVERFCDDVAAEVLVPSKRFAEIWDPRESDDPSQLAAMAAILKVTPVVCARRAVSLDAITERSFHEHARRWRPPAKRRSSGGPSPDRSLPSWYGRGIVELLSSAACTGHPAAADALDLLGVKLDVARTITDRFAAAKARAESKERKTLPKMGAFEPVKLDASWTNGSRLGSCGLDAPHSWEL